MVEQLIRPTGLPTILMSKFESTDGQIDDLVSEIKTRAERGERTLVTTLTKKMAEDLADYLREVGIRTYYLHSEQDAFQRVEVLRDLRLGVFDCLVGINLLREGLDLPRGFPRRGPRRRQGRLSCATRGSMVQTIGRAARHVNSHAILYADRVTDSMRRAMDETHAAAAPRSTSTTSSTTSRRSASPKEIRDIAADVADQVRDEFEMRAVAEDAPGYEAGLGGDDPREHDARIRSPGMIQRSSRAG